MKRFLIAVHLAGSFLLWLPPAAIGGSVSEYVGPPSITIDAYSTSPYTNETAVFFSGTYNRYVRTMSWSNQLNHQSGSLTVDASGADWGMSLPMAEGTNHYLICGINKTGESACVSASAIRVIPRPVLNIPESTISFTGVIGAPNPTGQVFYVNNEGTKELSYITTSLTAWVVCTTNGFVSPEATGTVWCQVVTTGLSVGATSGVVRIASNGGTQDVTIAVTMRRPTYHWTGGASTASWAERYNWSDLVAPAGVTDDIYFDRLASQTVELSLGVSREIRSLQIEPPFSHALTVSGQPLSLGADASGYMLNVRSGSGIHPHSFSNSLTLRNGNIYVGSLCGALFAGDVTALGGDMVLAGGGQLACSAPSASRHWAGSLSIQDGSTLSVQGDMSFASENHLLIKSGSRLILAGHNASDPVETTITNAAAGTSSVEVEGILELSASADRSDQLKGGHNGVTLGTNSLLQFFNDGAIDTYSYTLVSANSVSGRFEFIEAPYSHVVNYAPGLVTAGPRYPWTDSTGNHSWNSGFNWNIPGGGVPSPGAPLCVNANYDPTLLVTTSGYARSISFHGNGMALVQGNTGAVLQVSTTPVGEPFVQAGSNTQVNLDIAVQCPAQGHLWLLPHAMVSFQRALGDSTTERIVLRGDGVCRVMSSVFVQAFDVQRGGLEGNGWIKGTTTMEAGSVLSPGIGVGTNTFNNLVVKGTVRIDANGIGADQVVVQTNLTLNGACLQMDGAISSSRVYCVMSYGARAGVFADYKGFSGCTRLSYEDTQIKLYTVLGKTDSMLAGAWSRRQAVPVSAATDEVWFVESSDSWLRCSAGSFGQGSSSVFIEVDRNTNLTERTGTIIIAGVSYTVRQYGLFQPRNDFDGDGISDIGCYYPAAAYWYFFRSSAGFTTTQFGTANAYPVSGDFDGDGYCDYGTYHPASGLWRINKSRDGEWITQFGYEGTVPVVGDFDGDGTTDFGCYYAASGQWYVYKSSEGFWENAFGFANTVPVTGDFDGDGRCDFGCYYAKGGQWFVYRSLEGFWINSFGYEGTMPITGDFDGDGKGDFGCYYPPQGYWYIYQSKYGFWVNQFGYDNTYPITGDYDGDQQCDFGCYYPPQGYWYTYGTTSGFYVRQFGYEGTIPLGQ